MESFDDSLNIKIELCSKCGVWLITPCKSYELRNEKVFVVFVTRCDGCLAVKLSCKDICYFVEEDVSNSIMLCRDVVLESIN